MNTQIQNRNSKNIWDNIFNSYFLDEPSWANCCSNNDSLPTNIINEDEKYILELYSPGLNKKNLNIDVDNHKLIISYKYEDGVDKEKQAIQYVKREFKHNSFEKIFELSDDVDSNKISAKYEDGIITISLSKKAEKVNVKKNIVVS